MTLDMENLINSIRESIGRIDYIDVDDIPNIDLYMDQVTTFMDNRLRPSTRNKEEDKILTKTMINNYAKSEVLPPPVKKKYNKDHMVTLLFIYYFKNVLSISDIQSVLKPLNDEYFGKAESVNIQEIYEEIIKYEDLQKDAIISDIEDKFNTASNMFKTGDKEEEERLQIFSFITLLTADVYIKKLLIEKLIDGINDKKDADKKESKDSK